MAIVGSELLLALSFVRVAGDATSALFRTKIIDATLNQPIWGTALAWHIAGFVAALMFAHLVLGVTAWGLATLSRRAWPHSGNSARVWSVFWLVCLTLWILAANAAWFPSSSLGGPWTGVVEASFFGFSVFALFTFVLATSLVWMVALAARDWWLIARRRVQWTLGAVTVGASAAAFGSFGVSVDGHNTDRARPHVIVVGIDSLRPDALHAADGTVAMPALNDFLASSVVFTDAMTPLARTFPAWVSIVSGKHPHTTGAVVNLLPRELIDEGDTLPRLFSKAGYHTVYAIDEVRFSNLDTSYGFDEMITPPMGAADFMLGFFSDSPLANLLVNTAAGGWLFPYAHANRAAAVTYDPDTFIERLSSELTFDEPTLLAVHMTLAHWPYTWADSPPSTGAIDDNVTPERYRLATARVDQQFRSLMDLLRERGALQNAIVVVLSDHGESLGEPASIEHEGHAAQHIRGLEITAGHGTSVFAEVQYKVLLAMRAFGTDALPAPAGARLDVPASLEDITPTLAAALRLSPQRPFDGVSWLPALSGQQNADHDDRIRFTETEFVPPGFGSSLLTMSTSTVAAASEYYRVDPVTDRVQIRTDFLGELMENRQFAAFRDERMLAAVPSADGEEQLLIYLDRPGAEPRWLTTTPAPADNAYDLWQALANRFDLVRERPIVPPLGDPD